MRIYLIIREINAPLREIEILHSTSDSNDALDKLAVNSDKWEESIVSGKCRVMMTTYEE